MRQGRSYRERVKNRDSGETFRENLGTRTPCPGALRLDLGAVGPRAGS